MAEQIVEKNDASEELKQRLDSALEDYGILTKHRVDSYANVYTGVGGQQDKRTGGFPVTDILSYYQCADLYRSNDMAARIIDAPAEEMCRRGWDVAIQDDKDQTGMKGREMSEAASAYVEDLNEVQHFLQALKWARAFGGSGIFVGANDGQAADQPLNMNGIRSIDFLLPLDSMELIPNDYYNNPLEPRYGLPSSYRLNRFGISPTGNAPIRLPGRLGRLQGAANNNVFDIFKSRSYDPLSNSSWSYIPIVHESRILRFEGIIINRLQLRENWYWGDSVLVRCNEVLRDFNLAWSSASILLQDFSQAVIKLPGFAALLAKEGPTAFAQAAAMVERSRSTARALFLDKDDDFERKSTPTTGLPELLLQFCRRLSAAADMPMSRLMGDSPRGFNASGETDETWWYDKIAAMQKVALMPVLKQWYRIIFACKDGPTKGNIPGRGNWKVVFNPLKQLSDLQEADRRFRISQADAVSIGAGEYTGEEVALTRAGGDEYNGGKIQLLELDAKKRLQNRIDLNEKLNTKGAIGAAATNPGFDRRKTEVHVGTAGGNLPPVSSGSNSPGGSTRGDALNPLPPVVPPVIIHNDADKIAAAVAAALAPFLKEINKPRDDSDSEVDVIRDPKGQVLKFKLVSTRKA